MLRYENTDRLTVNSDTRRDGTDMRGSSYRGLPPKSRMFIILKTE